MSRTTQKGRQRRCRGKGEGSIYERKSGGALYIQWVDEFGRTRIVSTKSRDRSVASKILAEHIRRVRLLKAGVLSQRDESRRIGMSEDIQEHIGRYVAHCAARGQDERALIQKERNIRSWVSFAGIRTLRDCTAQSLSTFLHDRQHRHKGRSGLPTTGARVWNQIRAQAVAFVNWCFAQDLCEHNPLKSVEKKNERRDRRRQRRELTSGETSALLQVARQRGRYAWYLTALLGGLRKSDLQRLDWANVILPADRCGTIRFPVQKADRDDEIPMCRELDSELRARHLAAGSPRTGRVFPTTVTDRTRLRDLERAGIPYRDVDGRVVDLHALRTTTCMRLIRGRAPITTVTSMMRHRNIKTTLAYYTDVKVDEMREHCEAAVARD
jgi:integrase